MTPRQQQLLEFIRSYTAANGYAPTYLEMMEAEQIGSRSTVASMLSALEADGHIVVFRHRYRGIVVLEDQITPAVLHALPELRLKMLAAQIAGELATRGGAYAVATAYRNIADQLLAPVKAQK
jgi:SOS-response transcriptional repressor LexA